MKISFNKSVSLDKMDLWRSRYLDTLVEAQDQYLEFLIKDAAVYYIEIDDEERGYFITIAHLKQ